MHLEQPTRLRACRYRDFVGFLRAPQHSFRMPLMQFISGGELLSADIVEVELRLAGLLSSPSERKALGELPLVLRLLGHPEFEPDDVVAAPDERMTGPPVICIFCRDLSV